jgi:hypothetical protein
MIAFLVFAEAVALVPPAMIEKDGMTPAPGLRHEICYALATAPAAPADLARCLNLDRAPATAFTAYVCSFLLHTDQLEDFDFTTYSACLRDLLAR